MLQNAAPQRAPQQRAATAGQAAPVAQGAPVGTPQDEVVHYKNAAEEAESRKERASRIKTPYGARMWNAAEDDRMEAIRGLNIALAKANEGKEAEKAEQGKAEDEQKTQNRLGEFAARLGALSEEDRGRLGSTAQIREMHRAVQLGAEPTSILQQALKPTDAERGEGRAVAASSERQTLEATGAPIPPRLMSQEEKDAAWMDRLTKRAAFYESRGASKEQAATEAKADNSLEREVDKLAWVWNSETGRKEPRPIDWTAFSFPDKARLVRLYNRGELDDAIEDQMRDDPAFDLGGGQGTSNLIDAVRGGGAPAAAPAPLKPPSRGADPLAGMSPEARADFDKLPPEEQEKVRRALGG
jgi:hypothetical protein